MPAAHSFFTVGEKAVGSSSHLTVADGGADTFESLLIQRLGKVGYSRHCCAPLRIVLLATPCSVCSMGAQMTP